MKTKGLYFSLQFTITLLAFLVILGIAVYSVKNFTDSWRRELIITQCTILDRQLEYFAKNHRSVDMSSMTFLEEKSRLKYNGAPTYPLKVEELETLAKTQGFFRGMDFPKMVDGVPSKVGEIGYRVRDKNTHSTAGDAVFSAMEYSVTAMLPDKSIYVSPGSSFK